jgi:uncharacterized protein (TIGR02996 family)
MSEQDELASLYDALETNPADRVTRLALADWYEEHDQPLTAACLRWMVVANKYPYRYFATNPLRYHHESWAEGWYWWTTTEREPEGWGYPTACALPEPLWNRLRHGFNYEPTTFKEYRSVRATHEALIEAWKATPEKERLGKGG